MDPFLGGFENPAWLLFMYYAAMYSECLVEIFFFFGL